MKKKLAVVVLGLLLIVSACSSPSKPKASASPAAPPPQPSVLTGQPLKATTPIYIVKIDNTQNSAPQIGIDQGQMVIEELVEGGLTRLAVFYQNDLPTKVGHVRSLRGTDIGIAAPVKGILVASGGARQTIDKITAAGITVKTEDAGNAAGFSKDPAKRAPYNRLINLQELNGGATPIAGAVPYFQWAKDAATATHGTAAANSVVVRFSPAQTTRWAYANGFWARTNGTSQPEFQASNLVVLYAGQSNAGYLDPAGNPVPETKFSGSGRAVVFTGNTVTEGTWSKQSDGSTVQLKAADGKDIQMAPGKVWIELVPQESAQVSWN